MKVKFLNKNGSTLVLTLMVFSVLTIFAVFILSFMVTEKKQAIAHLNKTQAYYLARSAAVSVEASILEMSEIEQNNLVDLLKENKITGATVTGLDSLDNTDISLELLNSNVVISSTSNYRNTSVTVTKVMVPDDMSTSIKIDHAIFSKELLSLTNGTIEGDVGTNQSVAISGNPLLKGNIYLKEGEEIIFPGEWWESPWRKNYDDIVLESNKDYVFFDFPDYPLNLDVKDNIKTNSDNKNPTISSSGYYNSIIIDQNYRMTIDSSEGDIKLVVKDLKVPQGQISVIGSNKVSVYTESLSLGGGSLVNYNNSQPGDHQKFDLFYNGLSELIVGGNQKIAGNLYVESAKLRISESGGILGNVFTNGTNVVLSGNSDITRGLLYAPNAIVEFTGSGKIYGAVIADKFTLSGGGQVYYKPEYLEDVDLSIGGNSGYLVFSTPGFFRD
jgi:hypothetical protein